MPEKVLVVCEAPPDGLYPLEDFASNRESVLSCSITQFTTVSILTK